MLLHFGGISFFIINYIHDEKTNTVVSCSRVYNAG